jgi:hypothetical protein
MPIPAGAYRGATMRSSCLVIVSLFVGPLVGLAVAIATGSGALQVILSIGIPFITLLALIRWDDTHPEPPT